MSQSVTDLCEARAALGSYGARRVRSTWGACRMVEARSDTFPAMQHRRRAMDQKTDNVRRELWRAYERGALSEEEFAISLDRLEAAGTDLPRSSVETEGDPRA
jgi:hypothetical protein